MKDTTIRQEIQQAVIADNRSIAAVAGLDLGDKNSWLVRLELDGAESLNRSIRTSRSALSKYFSKQKRLRVVIEAGSHSNWIAHLLERLGHEVIVAHPRQLKLMSESLSKNDRRAGADESETARAGPAALATNAHRPLHAGLAPSAGGRAHEADQLGARADENLRSARAERRSGDLRRARPRRVAQGFEDRAGGAADDRLGS